MRQIKFRAWDGSKMYEPAIVNGKDWNLMEDRPIEGFTLMQLTGLVDKNGKDIYEGDVVRCGYGTGVVTYNVGCFMVEWIDDKEALMELLGLNRKFSRQREDEEAFEVIGNIHENPELLK